MRRWSDCGRAVDSLESAGGSIGDVLDVDLAFHRLLCELTGNATLVRAWGALTGPIRMAVMVAGPDRALATMSAVRHRRLVDAVATGDPDTARSAVDAHLRQAARTLLDAEQDRALRVELRVRPHGSTGPTGARRAGSRRSHRRPVDSQRLAINRL